jgi:hypothetical protein
MQNCSTGDDQAMAMNTTRLLAADACCSDTEPLRRALQAPVWDQRV